MLAPIAPSFLERPDQSAAAGQPADDGPLFTLAEASPAADLFPFADDPQRPVNLDGARTNSLPSAASAGEPAAPHGTAASDHAVGSSDSGSTASAPVTPTVVSGPAVAPQTFAADAGTVKPAADAKPSGGSGPASGSQTMSGGVTIANEAAIVTMPTGELVQITSSVTADAPGYEGLYRWEYQIDNFDFSSVLPPSQDGLGYFFVDLNDPASIQGVGNVSNDIGWESLIDVPAASIAWSASEELQNYIYMGGSGAFSFTTPPCSIGHVGAQVWNSSFELEGTASVLGPANLDNNGLVQLEIEGVDAAKKQQAPGSRIHINDNFDEQQADPENPNLYIPDYYQNRETGKNQIKPDDTDLRKAKLTIGPAGTTGVLTWNLTNVNVFWKNAASEWVPVTNSNSYTPAGHS